MGAFTAAAYQPGPSNRDDDFTISGERIAWRTLTGSGSYATGGDTLPSLPMTNLKRMVVAADATNNNGVTLELVLTAALTPETAKIKAYIATGGTGAGAGAEVANAAVLSGKTWRVGFIGV